MSRAPKEFQTPRSPLLLLIGLGALLLVANLAAQESVEEQLAPFNQQKEQQQALLDYKLEEDESMEPLINGLNGIPGGGAPGAADSSKAAKTPELPVETIDPKQHLPGLPTWIVIVATILILLFAAGLALLIIKLTKNSASSTSSTQNSLAQAQTQLQALRELSSTTSLSDLSVKISLILRQYLAESKSDKALYQTREEFNASEDRLQNLPAEISNQTSDFLTELASLKYARPVSNPEEVTALIDRGLSTLNLIANAHQELEPSSTVAHD